jgi:hypothetical protein
MKSNYCLVLSSLTFAAPAIISYKTGTYDLAILCALITIISSYYHYSKNPYLLYIDYPLNQITHITTVYRILPGRWASMPVYSVWLSYIIYIYYYGYLTKSLVWNPDFDAATPWHMTLHISSAFTTMYTVYATHNKIKCA